MKRIEAFLQPHRVGKVVAALHKLSRFPGFTLLDARGQGHGRGPGGEYVYSDVDGVQFHEHQILVVLCGDAEADLIVDLIASVAHTGNEGDGIVTVTHVQKVKRIRDAPAGGTDA